MLALTIEDTRLFTRELFVGTSFFDLLCNKVVIHHNVNYVMEGQYNLDFYEEETEREEKRRQQYASWEELQPLAFQIIKGRHMPISFQIVLSANADMVSALLTQSGSPLTQDQIDGLYLNILFGDETLSITTGSSYSIFTLDKTLEHAWEEFVKERIARLNIAYY